MYIKIVRELLLLLLFVIACRMTQCVAVLFFNLIPAIFFLYSNTIYVNIPLGSAVAMYSLDSPVILYSKFMSCILGNYGHARSQGGRQPAVAKPPWCDNTIITTPYSENHG